MGVTNTLAAISSSASVFVSGLIQDAPAAGMRCSRPQRWYQLWVPLSMLFSQV